MENLSSKDSKITFAPFRILSKAAEEKLDRGQSVAHQEEFQLESPKLAPNSSTSRAQSVSRDCTSTSRARPVSRKCMRPHIPTSSICELRAFLPVSCTLTTEQRLQQPKIYYTTKTFPWQSSNYPKTDIQCRCSVSSIQSIMIKILPVI